MGLFPPAPGGGENVNHGYKGKGVVIHLLTDGSGKPLAITTNVLAAGLAVLACEANSIRSRQQEPIGMRKLVLSCKTNYRNPLPLWRGGCQNIGNVNALEDALEELANVFDVNLPNKEPILVTKSDDAGDLSVELIDAKINLPKIGE